MRAWLPLLSLLLLPLGYGTAAERMEADSSPPAALFEAARKAATPEEAVGLLRQAASAGHAPAQKMLGLAYAQGHGGLSADRTEATHWFRLAAAQGDEEAAYNLVVLCEALPRCVGGGESSEQALRWLGLAAAQGVAEASFQLGAHLAASGQAAAALPHFLRAAEAEHPKALYNAAHLLATRVEGGAPHDLTRAIGMFGRAARAARRRRLAAVAADAAVAAGRLRRRWVQNAEAELELDALTRIFRAARDADRTAAEIGGAGGERGDGEAEARGEEVVAARGEEGVTASGEEGVEGRDDDDAVERALVSEWERAVGLWSDFQTSFAQQPSLQNEAAVEAMGRAVEAFASLLERRELGEYRRHLTLSKLVEGSRLLARDEEGMRRALGWLHALLDTRLCAELYAREESEPSCFNDQLAAAITLHRRLNHTAAADELLRRGRSHPHAATHWRTSDQTPRVFSPSLHAAPWWEAAQFEVARSLEALWASGEIHADLERLGVGARFERIVSTAAPIESTGRDDLRGEGVWSEFMLFDGERWMEERCKVTQALCTVLRSASEVNGVVVGADGIETKPQGQVTVFRLTPGSRVLPHVGVTNKRLVLQFPLRGFEGVRIRVGDTWRSYEEGHAMVFDDSFEHEVVHAGINDRYVLYAVLHHPGLGSPTIRKSTAELVAPRTSSIPESGRNEPNDCAA
ncbi:hypothetical protein AB1Y20_015370 [Prymnesium parvum]|uniref:Aspartyl/asparaginy/proline hydroxylase domain-containing protein n=1 Tax=Prymnesium parvum TaxID=97485 RepID=A0AB34K198_PRYPA